KCASERHTACPGPSCGICFSRHGFSISCVGRCECLRTLQMQADTVTTGCTTDRLTDGRKRLTTSAEFDAREFDRSRKSGTNYCVRITDTAPLIWHKVKKASTGKIILLLRFRLPCCEVFLMRRGVA